MFDEDFARIRAHRNNIHRYRRLLGTRLSDIRTPIYRETSRRGADSAKGAGRRNVPDRTYPSKRSAGFPELGGGAVSDVRDLLIRGCEKVIGHYRLLLASTKTEFFSASVGAISVDDHLLAADRTSANRRRFRPGARRDASG